MSQLAREDIQFIPVIACAFADTELEKMFKQFLPDNIPGGKSSMLGRFGPISSLFARIQFAFAFDMVHSDVLLALDQLRGYRNKIAHTWDQEALPDFVETPLPNMDDWKVHSFTLTSKTAATATCRLRDRSAYELAGFICFALQHPQACLPILDECHGATQGAVSSHPRSDLRHLNRKIVSGLAGSFGQVLAEVGRVICHANTIL